MQWAQWRGFWCFRIEGKLITQTLGEEVTRNLTKLWKKKTNPGTDRRLKVTAQYFNQVFLNLTIPLTTRRWFWNRKGTARKSRHLHPVPLPLRLLQRETLCPWEKVPKGCASPSQGENSASGLAGTLKVWKLQPRVPHLRVAGDAPRHGGPSRLGSPSRLPSRPISHPIPCRCPVLTLGRARAALRAAGSAALRACRSSASGSSRPRPPAPPAPAPAPAARAPWPDPLASRRLSLAPARPQPAAPAPRPRLLRPPPPAPGRDCRGDAALRPPGNLLPPCSDWESWRLQSLYRWLEKVSVGFQKFLSPQFYLGAMLPVPSGKLPSSYWQSCASTGLSVCERLWELVPEGKYTAFLLTW